MPLEYKSVPFQVKGIVEVSGGGWEIAGYASTFGGEPDSYGDVILKGAFAKSIASRPTKFLYEHGMAIGKQLEIREDDRGLFGRWSIVDTQAGTDAYKLAKAGVLDSLSIGYRTVEDEYRAEDGVRLLKEVELYEVSAVAIPANRNALITAVKSFEAHTADVQVAVREWVERCRAGLAQRQKVGRDLSQQRRDHMAAVSGSLRVAADEVDALLVPPAPPEVINVEAELRRRRYARAGITLERPA